MPLAEKGRKIIRDFTKNVQTLLNFRNGSIKGFPFIPAGLMGLLTVLLVLSLVIDPNLKAYAVMVDGHQIAVVKDAGVYQQTLEGLIQQGTTNGLQAVNYRENISLQPVKAKEEDLVPPGELGLLLAEKLHLSYTAVAIEINGVPKVVVGDRSDAEQVLEKLKEVYLPTGPTTKVLETKFEEEIAFRPVEVSADAVVSIDKAVEKLQVGEIQMKTYNVQEGDSLWTIARKNDMWVEDLQKANPQLTSEKLSIDQQINLVKAEPIVHLVAQVEKKTMESIPYTTKVEKSNSLYSGQERVKQKGTNGEKEVIYLVVQRNGVDQDKKVLESRVLTEPVIRIVTRGSKTMLASRGGGGSGQLAWPLRGQITSNYGYRGKEFHTGVDINGDTGEPIYAAESGTVIYNGWLGNYGRTVSIDHGDGVVTRYSHNSANKVSVGDKVTRGQLIALVGSTGRTTGSHLHFEVMVNGSFINPLRYLN
ncbi:MAG: peptidoglycan DD-metalloendopeptidase family protein [Bacillota bacterium]